EYVPWDQQGFNFAEFTPIIAPSDRQYYYGSFDRELCGKALTLFADFEFVRRFWGGAFPPRPGQPELWADSTPPVCRRSSGFSVPIQNPLNRFPVPDCVSPGGSGPGAPPAGTGFTTGVRYRFLEAGPGTPKVTADTDVFTAGLRGSLQSLGDYFKTWNWEAG